MLSLAAIIFIKLQREDEEDSMIEESRFDAAGCVSLIYKVEMEDKKGTDLPINIFSLICTPYTVDFRLRQTIVNPFDS